MKKCIFKNVDYKKEEKSFVLPYSLKISPVECVQVIVDNRKPQRILESPKLVRSLDFSKYPLHRDVLKRPGKTFSLPGLWDKAFLL